MPEPALLSLQQRVLRRFFELPESEGFALAGGAALILTGHVDRTTCDVDLFTPDAAPVSIIAGLLAEHLRQDGLDVTVLRSTPSFARLVARGDSGEVEVDLARDFRWRPARDTPLGPALQDEELAADKVLALFGRAEARDFVDFFSLTARFTVADMLAWAADKDRGFDRYVFAEVLGGFELRRREDFAVDDGTYAPPSSTPPVPASPSWRRQPCRTGQPCSSATGSCPAPYYAVLSGAEPAGTFRAGQRGLCGFVRGRRHHRPHDRHPDGQQPPHAGLRP